jgi:hypothetical protein
VVTLTLLGGVLPPCAFPQEPADTAPLEPLPPVPLEFVLPLGPKCLNGTYPITVKTTSGVIALGIDARGRVLGQLALGGSTFSVTGQHTVKAGVGTVHMTAKRPGIVVKLVGKLQGHALAGTSNGGSKRKDLTGPFVVDLSGAEPLVAETTLSVTIDSRGRIAGPGSAAVCGQAIPLTAKGKSVANKATLSLSGKAFVFTGKGTPAGGGFLVDWKGTSGGATAAGKALPILPVSESDTAKDEVVFPLPALSVNPPSPAGGSTATATVDIPGATHIALSAEGPGCGEFGPEEQEGSPLISTHAVGSFGSCTLSADADTPLGPQRYETGFTVEPNALLLPALEVEGGVFRSGDLPPETGSADDPAIGSLEAPGALIPGGTAQLRIHLADPAQADEISTVLVKVPGAVGFEGHYEVLPHREEGGTLMVSLRLAEELTAATSEHAQARFATQAATDQEIAVKLQSRTGRIGPAVPRSFNVRQVGDGQLQVSVSWDTPTDVDLHVVEPTTFEIYYGATLSPSGGVLDLDSNAGCRIDGVNHENIVWPSPPPGEYTVRVDFYSDCGPPPQGATYTVTINECGKIRTASGSFAPGTDDSGGVGSGVEVARFTPRCGSKRVRGKATYQDFAQTDQGLSATPTTPPIRFARVKVIRDEDGVLLATGETKQDGTFDIRFDNDNTGSPGYYVEVVTDQANAIVDQTVVDKNERPYFARSEGIIDEQQTPDKTDVLIEAKGGASGPAFNIFDVGVEGASVARRATGRVPPRLKWQWTRGDPGFCSGTVSCYKKALSKISVRGITADPDQYDDLVLLHEYGHFFQHNFSGNDHEGGLHFYELRSEPKLAWGEGSATFFGNYVRRSSLFLDTKAGGVAIRLDLESDNLAVPFGTEDGTQRGKLSEIVVASVLWDLIDVTQSSDDSGKDHIADAGSVFGAMGYLHSSFFHDREAPGADLVDFLDGWFCSGADNRAVLEDILDLHLFKYDFKAPPGPCRGGSLRASAWPRGWFRPGKPSSKPFR